VYLAHCFAGSRAWYQHRFLWPTSEQARNLNSENHTGTQPVSPLLPDSVSQQGTSAHNRAPSVSQGCAQSRTVFLGCRLGKGPAQAP
jgi:hypothetical protein